MFVDLLKKCEHCDEDKNVSLFNRVGHAGIKRDDPAYYTQYCSECMLVIKALRKQDPLAEYKTCISCFNTYVCLEFTRETSPLICYYCNSADARARHQAPVRKATHKAYYAREDVAAKKKEWMKAYMRRQAADLTDTYIKMMIAGSHKLPFKDITQDMIQLKRVTLLAKRVLADRAEADRKKKSDTTKMNKTYETKHLVII